MILKPDNRKNSIILYSCVVILDILYFYIFMGLKFDVDGIHYAVLVLINVPSIGLFTASIVKTRLILTDNALEHHQLFHIRVIKYKDIAYIDIPMSTETPNLYMIGHDKKTIIITMDREKKLLSEMLKRCYNTISIDEMEKRGFFKQDDSKDDKKKKKK